MDAKSLMIVIGGALLSACMSVDHDSDAPEGSSQRPDQCGALQFQSLIGSTAGSINEDTLPEPYRIICHGCMVTKDYRLNRLNIWLDEADKVERVDCG
jgi:hypothetical protein